jgi:hypothetical protein
MDLTEKCELEEISFTERISEITLATTISLHKFSAKLKYPVWPRKGAVPQLLILK